MAQEGSVAPKERVNVVYRPATGDAKEEVELPLKVLVMGDFTLREDERAVEDRKPINIDKDNFNDVLAGQKLQLKTAVPDTLSREPDAEMSLELDFKSIKDFTPDAIVEKIPQLKQILELREALKAVKGPLGNIPAFKKKLSSIIDDEDAKAKLLAELGIEE
ncbi:MAG: type VI secretion system contractile sheath small subunit [Candidatus Electrothrix sp. AX5]|jgi:type VI secretion system protein ImpB|uniref:Type VI secretion system protein ImpB n=1 Tax=Candidatus Electrothrix aarhusensis TaxID=1859131 RepID=A0A444IQ70_9BACT|nr:type VI secretion system contractile sheath small subunit [Candidatus Electrothrix sp. AX5]RWX42964.1 type VI secretion system protein ImpB [Candidatus Electrothrix aarhusensis]